MQQDQPSIDYKQLYEQLLAEQEQLRNQVMAQSAELAQLRKMIFGVRTERFIPAADATAAQLQLALDLSAETVARCKISSTTTIEYVHTKVELIPANPKPHPGRMKLPAHLRREVILLKPETDITGLKKMGEEVTDLLDFIPAELYVKQYIRHKYAAPLDEGGSTVITASLLLLRRVISPGQYMSQRATAMPPFSREWGIRISSSL